MQVRVLASRLPAKITDFHGCAFVFTPAFALWNDLAHCTRSACIRPMIEMLNSTRQIYFLAKFALFNTLNQGLGLTVQVGKPTFSTNVRPPRQNACTSRLGSGGGVN